MTGLSDTGLCGLQGQGRGVAGGGGEGWQWVAQRAFSVEEACGVEGKEMNRSPQAGAGERVFWAKGMLCRNTDTQKPEFRAKENFTSVHLEVGTVPRRGDKPHRALLSRMKGTLVSGGQSRGTPQATQTRPDLSGARTHTGTH